MTHNIQLADYNGDDQRAQQVIDALNGMPPGRKFIGLKTERQGIETLIRSVLKKCIHITVKERRVLEDGRLLIIFQLADLAELN